MHRVIRLDPDQQLSNVVQDIHAVPGARHHQSFGRHLQTVRHPVLRKVEGALVSDLGAVVRDVVSVDRAVACRVEARALAADARVDGAVDGAGVGYVEGGAVGTESNAVRLDDGVIDQECGAGVRVEAVAGGGELWGGVGEFVEPGVVWVGEEDVATDGVDGDVVDGVEIVAEVVVE